MISNDIVDYNFPQLRDRKIYAKVRIDYSDFDMDTTIVVNPGIKYAENTRPEQIANGKKETTGNFIAFDGSWILDGTFVLGPNDDVDGVYNEIGLWSYWSSLPNKSFGIGAALYNEGQLYEEDLLNDYYDYPEMFLTFQPRGVVVVDIAFDTTKEEYAEEFDVEYYAIGETLLHTEVVTGNTSPLYYKVLTVPLSLCYKIVIRIKKWSKAGTQAKVAELFTSLSMTYEGDDIVSIDLLRERENTDTTLTGVPASSEVTIELVNKERMFDYNQINSPLYTMLKTRNRVTVWFGAKNYKEREYFDDAILYDTELLNETCYDRDTELGYGALIETAVHWVQMGIYYVIENGWEINRSEPNIFVTAQDRMSLLNTTEYTSSTLEQNKSLEYLAGLIADDAGLVNYYIDPELDDTVIPWAYFDSVTYKAALQNIVSASLGAMFVDRNGLLRIEGNNYIEENHKSVCLEITEEQIYSIENPNSDIYNVCKVQTQPLTPDSASSQVYSGESITLDLDEEETLTCFFTSSPIYNPTASVASTPSGATILSATYYPWGAVVTVKASANAQEIVLSIAGYAMNITGEETRSAEDTTSIRANGRKVFVMETNPLIQTRAKADAMVLLLLEKLNVPRRNLTIEWRGNPALDLGDCINVNNKGYSLVKSELHYDGVLTEDIELEYKGEIV